MTNETVQTQDGITGQLATETDLASYDFAKQQLNAMQTPTFGNFSQDPNVKVYFVLQDGTRNDAINDPNHLTNVGILESQLRLIARDNPNIGVGYTPGVGTEGRGAGTIDAITGGSYDLGVGMAYKQFAEQVAEWKAENPDVTVRVINVSFSRGVPEAAGLTQLIDRIGVVNPDDIDPNTINQQTNINAPTLIQPNTIAQAVVSFDPVATGEGLERDLVFADSVISGFQINANDEFRTLFPVTNLIEQGHTFDGKFLGVTTAGAHTNIGGSYLDNFLSNLNFNLAVTYINSLFEEPILSPISDSSNPIIHHSAEHQWFYRTSDERNEINDLDKNLDGVQKISERDGSLASQFTYKAVGGDGQGISTAGQYKILSEADWKFARDFLYNNLSENDVTYFQNAKGETFVAIKEEKLLININNDDIVKDATASLTKFLTDNHQLTTEENTKNWFQKVGTTLSGWVDSTADFIKNTAASIGDAFGGIGNAISEIGSWVSSVFTLGESDKIPDQSTVDNSQLNLDIRTDLTSNFLGNNNITQTGNVIGDGDWEVSAPINNLNGDGYKNVAPYGIVSDQFRPGNSELSQYANFNTELRVDFRRLDNLMNNQSSQQLNFQLQNPLANLTNNFINARTFLNIDPVVLDLNGDGVKLTSYNDSEVTFDVDNDGKQERTGWVSNQDGILVEDQNNNGKIDNITETISEYYKLQGSNWTKDGEGKYSSDGLAALKKLDSNNDGKFNSSDAKWNDLKIWVDANGDAGTDAGELKTLTEAGIKEINLSNITQASKERNEGNIILAKSTYTTTDNKVKQVAAVDFTTNPIGYEFNDVNLGKLATAEDGTKSLVIRDTNGATVTASNDTAQNIFGNVGNDTIIGDSRDNWISGGSGSDSLQGGAGDDILIIDSEDKQENIDGGEGRDIVIINSDKGVSFNLTESHIETAVGGNGDDVLIGGGTSNVFIDGGSGDDIIIGGAADDALAGSDGNDYIDGGYGDDVIRGHRGQDILIGGLGDDYLEGGLDDDKVFAGAGNDVIMEGAGNDEIDCGEGYDLVKYQGSYKDYKIIRDGTNYKIQDLKTGYIDSIKNIEGVRFTDVTLKLVDGNISPLPVADLITLQNKSDTIELFDQYKVSFASVTQNFTTDDSVGRLMLNVMLSFAQYERELTGERIRDKIDASKKKGMWMGGTVPLGYDAKERKLTINPEESKIIAALFDIFIETESVTETARELTRLGFSTKTWISRTGKIQRGKKFNKAAVRRIIENPLYTGKIKHKNKVYDGLHQGIISDEIWQEANNIINRNHETKIISPISRVSAAPLLKGVMNCGICGSKMTPTYTSKKGKRYRYYICSASSKGNNDLCKVGRIPASEAENVVTSQILNILKKPEFIVRAISQSSKVFAENTVINNFKQIEKVWDELFPVEQARIINLLVKDIEVRPEGFNIRIFKEGINSLSNELTDVKL